MCQLILKVHIKIDQRMTYLKMLIRCLFVFSLTDFLSKSICCGYPFELHRQVDAIQIGTHNICLYKNINKKYSGCNLMETGLHDCALIGVCAVIRSNTVLYSALKVSRHVRKWIFWRVLNKAQAAHPRSLISLLYLPKCAQWRFWSNHTNAQADQNLHWAHMSEGTVSGAGLSGSAGCAVWLETMRSRVQPPPRSATFFHGDWSWNIFYSHSLPSADSRRAVVSFWWKNVHNTG